MNAYLLVKCLHIISSVILVGTGFGTAFYFFFANRSKNLAAIAVVSRLVVRADMWLTLPAVVFQPLSGWWLMRQAGWSFDTPWIALAIALYLLAGACWLPVVWLQIRLRDIAREAVQQTRALPDPYWRYAQWWEWLGYPAFVAMVFVFFLMVTKP